MNSKGSPATLVMCNFATEVMRRTDTPTNTFDTYFFATSTMKNDEDLLRMISQTDRENEMISHRALHADNSNVDHSV